ncbi:hypothetical protein FRB97_005137 [Tulasnella sp. 331]|nr:hypothetical protein FRB97_005137 [Tulasnella sp. 331]
MISSRRRPSGLYSRITTVNLFRFFWVCIFIWCEVGSFFWSLSDCRWPDRQFKKIDRQASPGHVMIIADPHYRASTIYNRSTSWKTRFVDFVLELNLRKSWNAASRLSPHIVIMLGDMLEHGRTVMTDDQYDEYHQRFSETFKIEDYVQRYYATGNHDVGLGSHRSFSGQARRRFRQRFGPEQQVVDFGNHSFVFIDAPALVDEDYRRHAAEIDFDSWQGAKAGPISFVKAVKNNPPPPNKPTILISHIPLARRETASCGPLREDTKGIRRGAGYGFQNLLGRETTHFVLQSLKPTLVISGDDHDYCEHTHRDGQGPDIREVTVRSFSMGIGVKQPGFLLLSLYTPDTPNATPTRSEQACLLPDQFRVYTFVYIPFFFLTVIYITYINFSATFPTSSRITNNNGSRRAFTPLRLSSNTHTPEGIPSTPNHLMVRKSASTMNVSDTLTPRSRPSSPMLSPRILYDDNDIPQAQTSGGFPFPASPLLPSLMPLTGEPEKLDIEGSTSSPSLRPSTLRSSSVGKKWDRDNASYGDGWKGSIRHASGRGKSKSSKEWLSRQSRDPFVKQRNAGEGGPIAGYRARSAFKLLEMSDRFNYLMHGAKVVVDLGAAPGGWSQVVAKKMNLREAKRQSMIEHEGFESAVAEGADVSRDEQSDIPEAHEDGSDVIPSIGGLRRRTVIAVDLLPISPIPGVNIIQGDFLSPKTQDQISALIPAKWMVDIVLSDMSPSISGNRLRDVDQSLELCTAAFMFSKDWLVSSRDTGRSHSGVLVYVPFSLSASHSAVALMIPVSLE